MKSHKRQKKLARQGRIRARVSGTTARPRIAIFRSNRFTYAQVIDDASGKTVIALSDIKAKKGKAKKSESAMSIGKQLAATLKEKGINEAVFDRGGFRYHGRVKALADGLREGGIKI
jgi:large subunit ribosomal protein L18